MSRWNVVAAVGALGAGCSFDVPNVALAPRAPRLRAPLSTSVVTGVTPRLRWALGLGDDGAVVQVCADRGCERIEATLNAWGGEVRTPALRPGVHFWRARGRNGGVVGSERGPTWEFFVGHRNVQSGTTKATVPDFNGDGYADVVVGAPTGPDAVYVYLSRQDGPRLEPVIEGTRDGFGVSVTAAGDLNGDGFGDLAVGRQNGERVMIYLGGPYGLTTHPTTLIGPDGAGSGFGTSISGAGDVDADGYADLVVGASCAPYDTTGRGGCGPGRAYVYRGRPEGIWTMPSYTLSGSLGSGFGASVSGAGDIDGDGDGDVVVGAPESNGTSGRAYIFTGRWGGFDTTPAVTLTGPTAALSRFGSAVANAGDVNGDGYADIVVGTRPPVGDIYAGPGSAYVFFGGLMGIGAMRSITLTDPDGAADSFGLAVAGAGDVNGDGFDDVAIGSPRATRVGRVYVYQGTTNGLVNLAPTVLSGADGEWSSFGGAVAPGGDSNRDGFDDLVVGAPCAPSNGDGRGLCGTGRAYLFLGATSGFAPSPYALIPTSGRRGFGGSVAQLKGVGRRGRWPG